MKYPKKSGTASSPSLISPSVSGPIIGTPPAGRPVFLPWQPSTWPSAPANADANFITDLRKIFDESILGEIRNVIQDIKTNNGDLQHRGHVVAIALMCALDALSSYGYRDKHMAEFVRNHFPSDYPTHADEIYKLYRNSLVHSWNLFEVSILPGNEAVQKTSGTVSFGLLDFFDALQTAANDFLDKLVWDKNLQ